MKRILVVDDDELMRDSLGQTLAGVGYQVETARSGREGLDNLKRQSFELVLTDLRMPEVGGIELLEELRRQGDETPVILITAYGAIDTAVSAMKGGASDYIVKPFQRDTLLVAVEKALAHEKLRRENAFFRRQTGADPDTRPIIGQSAAIKGALLLVEKYAPSSGTVLIRGASGTGKELFARLLHHASPRRTNPFLSVNCAALSAGLLESELFGHEKGAFTGAERRNIGRFEIADGGTLLLDEVSEIDTRLQAKLLRVLQEKEFDRVGNARTIKVDVRVVATTNRDLEREVAQGRFREDLYFRLTQLVIDVPPLADRKEDIPLLAEHFLRHAVRAHGGKKVRLSTEALESLAAYSWPGNVRELENLIERAYLLCEGDVIGPEILGVTLKRSAQLVRIDGEAFIGKKAEDVERAHILATLRHTGWHQKRAAELLGIGVRTLREKIKRWNLRAECEVEK
jgi:DNA-binding NtrC family response regulator